LPGGPAQQQAARSNDRYGRPNEAIGFESALTW
jgi:hypothetical protein